MALEFTYCEIGKGIEIDGDELFNFYGQDFNPNVPTLPLWDTAGVTDQTSSFDLSGFQPGHEVGCCVAIYKNNDEDNPRTQHVYADFYQGTSGSPTWTFDAGYITVPAGGEWMSYIYFGIDYDEIWSGYSNYRVRWQMNDDAINATFSVSGLSIDSSLHPSGYMWVEGLHLCYTDGIHGSRGYKHKIAYDSGYSDSVGSSNSGYMWLDENNNYRIYYVDAYGGLRRTYQSSERYGGNRTVSTSKKGYIWVSDGDMEDGYGHLCFIAPNGSKRRLLNGPIGGRE